MKLKLMLLIGVIGSLAASGVQAQNSFWYDHFAFDPGEGLFEPQELSLDLFGFYGSRNRHGSDESAWGPGVGLNYFVTENWGFGADTYADAFREPYLLNGNVIYRYPIETAGLAPYAFAGFGRQWTYAAQWMGDLGGGVEYRINAKTGLFTDLRGVFPQNTSNYAVWRFGIRLVF